MDHVGIVGAGVAGAGAAYALSAGAPDVDVTVLEQHDRVGGRAATRTRGEYTYDIGANYCKPDDDRVARLLTEDLETTGLVDVSEPVYTFDAVGTVSPGRDADAHKWTYESGLVELSRRLFAATAATIHRKTTVDRLARIDDDWLLHATDGTRYGPFDAIVLTPPAPASAALIERADWDAKCRGPLANALAAVQYRTICSAALGYRFELARPYYGLVNTDDAHDIGWLSREECKRGHVPEGETLLIVQASPDWSVAHADEPPAETANRLATKSARLVDDDRVARPAWTDTRLWERALPEGAVDAALVAAARESGVQLAGDAIAGERRIHAALRSGLEAGERLVAEA